MRTPGKHSFLLYKQMLKSLSIILPLRIHSTSGATTSILNSFPIPLEMLWNCGSAVSQCLRMLQQAQLLPRSIAQPSGHHTHNMSEQGPSFHFFQWYMGVGGVWLLLESCQKLSFFLAVGSSANNTADLPRAPRPWRNLEGLLWRQKIAPIFLQSHIPKDHVPAPAPPLAKT